MACLKSFGGFISLSAHSKSQQKIIAKRLQTSVAFKGCRNYKPWSDDSFLLKILVTKLDDHLGGDISMAKVVIRLRDKGNVPVKTWKESGPSLILRINQYTGTQEMENRGKPLCREGKIFPRYVPITE